MNLLSIANEKHEMSAKIIIIVDHIVVNDICHFFPVWTKSMNIFVNLKHNKKNSTEKGN